ncbi:MAG: hypothetical protein K940chlam9_01625 [Chlamydiae bacterium]|nr:hypothetical protein [Chlamydiota bacterium]
MAVKAKEVQQSDILRIEAEINNLWGELNTSNVPNRVRTNLEARLSESEDIFKKVLNGQSPIADLENGLQEIDMELAQSVVQQAENEISKAEHTGSAYLALQEISRELKEGRLTPIRARHEVKGIMRPHHS